MASNSIEFDFLPESSSLFEIPEKPEKKDEYFRKVMIWFNLEFHMLSLEMCKNIAFQYHVLVTLNALLFLNTTVDWHLMERGLLACLLLYPGTQKQRTNYIGLPVHKLVLQYFNLCVSETMS